MTYTAPATFPPSGLYGLERSWSRLVSAPDADGVTRTWHVLDNGVADPEITLLCVHGNPTWSYLWRSLLAAAPDNVRVVAPDHLDMGFSERTGTTRRLGRRIEDLAAVVDPVRFSLRAAQKRERGHHVVFPDEGARFDVPGELRPPDHLTQIVDGLRSGSTSPESAEPLEQNGYKVPLLRAAVEESLLAVVS